MSQNIDNNSGNFVSINFVGEKGIQVFLQGEKTDKLSVLIDKYRAKIKNYTDEFSFYYYGKEISPEQTIEEIGITNGSSVMVSKKSEIAPIPTPSSAQKEAENEESEIKISDEINEGKIHGVYTDLKKGFNVLALCTYKKCKSHKKDEKKEVICFINNRDFDLIENSYDVICPYCSCPARPLKFIFYKCTYCIHGKQIAGEQAIPYAIGKRTVTGEVYHSFDLKKNNYELFTQLKTIIYKLED